MADTNTPQEEKKPGFRMGDYFVSFPEDEFVKEDEQGNMFVIVDIYHIQKDGVTAKKLAQEEVTEEIENMIGIEINRLLLEGSQQLERKSSDE